ncbi:MAG: hypothetical protein IJU76_08395 [Desulfovibrionaceae bacterium]|nr:hypothetical protein [Desulfovibrionaceae bacterium]
MFKAIKDTLTQEVFFLDVATHTQYRRTVCALAWPWLPSPGAVVVLAERRNKPPVLNEKRHLDLVAECISETPDELMSQADRYMAAFKVPQLVTPVDDERIALLDALNDERRERRKQPLRYQHPVEWHGKGEGLLPYYVSLIRARIVNAKTLHFSQYSQLPAECAVLNSDTMPLTQAMITMPSVCALAWAVEAIDRDEPHSLDTSALLQGPSDRLGGY